MIKECARCGKEIEVLSPKRIRRPPRQKTEPEVRKYEVGDNLEVPDPVISGYSARYFCFRCRQSFIGKKKERPKYCPDCEKALADMPKPYSALNGEFNERRE